MGFLHLFNKAIVFLKPSSASYWHTITRNTLTTKPLTLGRYYLNFESKLDYPEPFDDNNIPLYKLADIDYFHHPIVVCQYALGIFEHFFQSNFKDNRLERLFFKQVDWLESKAVDIGIGKVWYVGYDIPEYNLFQPWYLGLSQGEAASVLTRAYELSKDEKYLKLAEDAIKPFDVPVSEGGLLNYFNSIPVYEEYPSPNKTVGAFCGFMFILFGFYDLMLVSDSSLAKKLFINGISALKKLLPYYDLGYWSRYYIYDYPQKYVSSFTYHSLQYEQLRSLYFITGDAEFLFYSEKWEAYTKKFFFRLRALYKKITYAKKLGW